MSTTSRSRIHPLMAAAAVSTTLVSVMGIAALSGVLPWMPVNAPQKSLAGPSGLRTAAAVSAVVVPTASLKTTIPLTVADSLAPGESLVAGDIASASLSATPAPTLVPALPSAPAVQAVPSIHAASAMPKIAPDQMTLAKTIAPPVFSSHAIVAPVVIPSTPRNAAVVAAPRKLEAARQSQFMVTTDAANRLPREHQRARDMAVVTSAGSSNNGTSAAGAGPGSVGRSPDYRAVANEQRLYSDARAVPNATPKITPIYRGDNSSDPVPPVIYPDQVQPLQVQRPANRASGDLAIVSDRYRSDQSRRFGNVEGSSTAYPVASMANGSERDNLNANTTGTMIGRVVSNSIDKTISVISDVLNGRYAPPPPSESQDGNYR